MKAKTPKNIYPIPNSTKFRVLIQSKVDKKLITVGSFENISEAIKARDLFIVSNYEDLTKGYLPRGIIFQKEKYRAYFSFKKTTTYIGCYKKLSDAINARNEFINCFK